MSKSEETITHHQCDICGDEIEKYWSSLHRFEYDKEHKMAKDICEDCRHKLHEWLKRLKKDGFL